LLLAATGESHRHSVKGQIRSAKPHRDRAGCPSSSLGGRTTPAGLDRHGAARFAMTTAFPVRGNQGLEPVIASPAGARQSSPAGLDRHGASRLAMT